MNQVFPRTLAALALGASTLLGLAPPAQASSPFDEIVSPMTAAQTGQVSRGEIVVAFIAKHPIYHMDVYGAIDAPFDAVWKSITDYADYKEFLPLVVESYIKKRGGGATHQFVRMQPPWPLHDHYMVNINVENRARGTVAWTMTPGETNLRFERGFWQLRPMGPNRTMMQYHLTVDPWLDVVPAWLVEFATRQVLPDVVKGVRKRSKAYMTKG